jgi:PmbA protein
MPDTAAPDLSTLTARLLDAARRAGAGAADAIAVRDASVSIDVRGGRLEEAQRAEGVEIGLRVLIGGRQACVSASDTSDRTIAEMAERAVAMARLAPEDPFAGLADPAQLTADRDAGPLDLIDPSPEPDPTWLQDQARAAEAAALAVPGVTQCEGAGAGWGRRDVALAATNGFAGAYGRTSVSLSVSAITGTGTGMERDWAGEGRTHRADLPAPDGIGRLAGERAVARAGARKPPTGTFPVLYDERVAGQLVGHLLSAINGQSLARGASWLRDGLGEAVLPAGMTLTEDPRRPRQSGSRPFDAEGLACAARDIVADGVLMAYTLDLASARKLGLAPTGHAQRGTGGPPSPGNGNIALTQGTASRDDLIRDMGTGLLVTSMIGASINATTGDYSRGASGFWVENGQIAYPVNECTVAGNLRAMLRTLVPANDARTHLSRVVPSLLVEGLTVAGA